ncbi:MAG: restriction endonuclease subunit S, partial [Gaiellaceae bacterium]
MRELPCGWAWSRLDEVAEVRLGRQRSPKNHSGARMRPYLRAANVTWEGLDLSDVKEMNFSADESEIYELRDGDVVVAEASGSADEVGKPALWRGEIDGCCFQNTLVRVRSRGVLPEYLRYFLLAEARTGRIGRASPGVGIHHIGAARLSAWLVPAPPLAEQQRIVATIEEQLSRLDAAEAELRQAASRLALLERAAVEGAFSADWPRQPLSAIAELVGGVTKNQTAELDPTYVAVPYLRVANVQRGYLDLSNVTMIRVPPDTAARLALRVGDVLFNEGGDRDKLGRGWVWSGEIDGCIHQNHVFRARLAETFEPRFVSWWGNSFGRDWFWEHGRQTTNLASMSLSTLKAFPVPSPPLAEQQRAVDE